MYNKSFKNIDHIDCKIVAFEMRKKKKSSSKQDEQTLNLLSLKKVTTKSWGLFYHIMKLSWEFKGEISKNIIFLFFKIYRIWRSTSRKGKKLLIFII